jgi:hypothetical protein
MFVNTWVATLYSVAVCDRLQSSVTSGEGFGQLWLDPRNINVCRHKQHTDSATYVCGYVSFDSPGENTDGLLSNSG